MTVAHVVRRRLARQRLSSPGLGSGDEVVRLLTCVQSQEYQHALWSLGMRTAGSTYAGLQAEFDRGGFLRTHLLRPTWHFVAPQDVRWILGLTTPRVEMRWQGMAQRLGLTEVVLGRAEELIRAALVGQDHLARRETARLLASDGLPATGIPFGHLLLMIEMRGVLVNGPMVGPAHTHRLLDDVIPYEAARDDLDRDEALGRLAVRFFGGHGPASVTDLGRWATLTQADVKRGIAVAGDALESVVVDRVMQWCDPSVPARTTTAHRAYLLPVFDELTLTSLQLPVPAVADHPDAAVSPPTLNPHAGAVVADGNRVGTWKRRLVDSGVEVDLRLASSLDNAARTEVYEAVLRLAAFLDRPLVRT